MNWYVHGRTSQKVGFQQDGSVCEGGSCEHLKEGDQAHGYSGEADSFGQEHYLMCEECYEKFLKQRRIEPIECDDCSGEFPRNQMYRYVPYYADGSPSEIEDAKRWVCKNCQELPRHKQRLENDEYHRHLDDERSHDFDDHMDFDDDDDEPDELPDEDLDPDRSEQIFYWGRDSHKPRRFSKGILTVSVVDKNFW